MRKTNVLDELNWYLKELTSPDLSPVKCVEYILMSRKLICEIDSAMKKWEKASAVYKRRLDWYEGKQ